MNNGLYEHLKVFVAIAQTNSVTAASIATGIAQASMSRQLVALEKHLGCRLFQRSTRAIRLTEQGETYLQHALRLIELTHDAQCAVQEDGKTRLKGRLRVACSNGFGRKIVIPALPRWQQQQPEVEIELMLSDQISQVIEERVDLAIRIAPLPSSNLLAHAIGKSQPIVIASPAYLRKHGTPSDPSDLQQHQCLLFSGMEQPSIWRFTGVKGVKGVTGTHVHGRLKLSSMDALVDAVLADLGIALMPEWFWRNELLDGRVKRLLPEFSLASQNIHAVTASRQRAGSKIKVFTSFVETLLEERGMTL